MSCQFKMLPIMTLLLLFVSTGSMAKWYSTRYRWSNGDDMVYPLFSPDARTPGKRYPLVIYLHGVGELGAADSAKGTAGKAAGTYFADSSIQRSYPAYVYMPNVPDPGPWIKVSSWGACAGGGFTFATTPESQSIIMVWRHLDSLLSDPTLQIDSTNIFLTGFSQGGYGTFDAITRHPDKFRAAMPVAGGGYTEMAATIKHIPLWAFHGSADDIIPLSCSQKMVAAINEAGGNATLTTLQGGGHVIAGDVYNTSKRGDTLMSWFMGQRGQTSLEHARSAIQPPIAHLRISNGNIEYAAPGPISITLSDMRGRTLQRYSGSGPTTFSLFNRTHAPGVGVVSIRAGQATMMRTVYLSAHSKGLLY